MRKLFLFLTIFLALPGFSQQKNKFFTLYDGDLDSGSVMRRYDILFDFDKASLRPEDSLTLDSIAHWIIIHPEFTIEVDNHIDYEDPKYSMNLTFTRAKAIVTELINLGVPFTQIAAKGYGDRKNIISQAIIAKNTSQIEKDSLRRINRRTEFKIIAVNAKLMHPFLLSDKTFWPGEVLRDEGKILFDLGYAGLRPESKTYLDTIVLFMKAHPALKVEVDSHTDIRGSWNYNLKLSGMRAACIMDYLVSQGIDQSRLSSKGFGESQPIIPEEEIKVEKTKEEQENFYRKNRRTEFKIISVK
jgi:outer membrane protein OmpA-like peptidoglycan-associated protein